MFLEILTMENTRKDAPICPQCKKPMEPGRVNVAGFPHLQSFECWPCLEVISEESRGH